MLKEKLCIKISTLCENIFQILGENRHFQTKKSWGGCGEYISSGPALQEMLKEVLQAEGK